MEDQNIFFRLAVKLGITKPPPPDKREVYVGEFSVFTETPGAYPYPNNKIVSSKYTAWNFLPKNLFEQFQRLANFYFGVVSVVLLLIDAPVSPVISILPLAFVVCVAMAKQGYEDWVRHRADKQLNNAKVRVVHDGFIKNVKCEQIHVGDLVEVQADEEIPADLIFLSSSEPENTCYVTTANLDGETNLKVFNCMKETSDFKTREKLRSLNAFIECEQPQVDLYKFNGRITVEGSQTRPLSADNLLLRGSSLKNTDYVYGVAVYTGKDTKMAKNSKFKPHKVSTVEGVLNRFLVVMLLILILESLFLTVMFYYYMTRKDIKNAWYLVENIEDITAGNAVNAFLTFSSLINYIVPISLYVTMELQKFLGALFFDWDEDMYDSKTSQYAKANTSDLNEDLGQVEYLFADKTGTLTENEMLFRQCSVEGVLYHEMDCTMKRRSESGTKYIDIDHAEHQILQDFFLKLALCHTVHVNHHVEGSNLAILVNGREDRLEFQASSPDEKALLEAAFRQHVAFVGLNNGCEMRIIIGEKEEVVYTLHHVLEFDATRKRMSVVVESPSGELSLLCKGAETAILPRCTDGPTDSVMGHVNMYAEEGLRTLCIAEKRLSKQDFNQIDSMLLEAKNTIENRDDALAAVFDQIESGMTCVGATAVEDQLQTQVPETIEYLRHAGIKVWILTGDKIETARNISYSCRHFKRGMNELSLLQQRNADDCTESLTQLVDVVLAAYERGEEIAITVDGQSLAFTMESEHNRQMFLTIGLRCSAVLCCRLSPLQKSEVVTLVRYSPDRPVTLAIGDGANDVSMIQEAHVGIGVMGKEGRQAVRCSDYAIGRFMFLQKALLVHGHWYYHRISVLILYFFYKNMAFMNCQLMYLLLCAYSGQTLFHSFSLTFFNVFFTAAPILVYGVLEQKVPAHVLLKYPSFYKDIRRNAMLTWPQFFLWVFYCVWHAAVIFWSVFVVLPSIDNWMFGLCVYHLLILVLNIKLCLHTKLWSAIFASCVLFTFLFYFGFNAVYNVYYWPLFQSSYEFYWLFFDAMSIGKLWWGAPLVVSLCFVPDLLVKFIYLVKEKKTPISFSNLRALRGKVVPVQLTTLSKKNSFMRGGGGFRGSSSDDKKPPVVHYDATGLHSGGGASGSRVTIASSVDSESAAEEHYVPPSAPTAAAAMFNNPSYDHVPDDRQSTVSSTHWADPPTNRSDATRTDIAPYLGEWSDSEQDRISTTASIGSYRAWEPKLRDLEEYPSDSPIMMNAPATSYHRRRFSAVIEQDECSQDEGILDEDDRNIVDNESVISNASSGSLSSTARAQFYPEYPETYSYHPPGEYPDRGLPVAYPDHHGSSDGGFHGQELNQGPVHDSEDPPAPDYHALPTGPVESTPEYQSIDIPRLPIGEDEDIDTNRAQNEYQPPIEAIVKVEPNDFEER